MSGNYIYLHQFFLFFSFYLTFFYECLPPRTFLFLCNIPLLCLFISLLRCFCVWIFWDIALHVVLYRRKCCIRFVFLLIVSLVYSLFSLFFFQRFRLFYLGAVILVLSFAQTPIIFVVLFIYAIIFIVLKKWIYSSNYICFLCSVNDLYIYAHP